MAGLRRSQSTFAQVTPCFLPGMQLKAADTSGTGYELQWALMVVVGIALRPAVGEGFFPDLELAA